jgi:hypothetical protein
VTDTPLASRTALTACPMPPEAPMINAFSMAQT